MMLNSIPTSYSAHPDLIHWTESAKPENRASYSLKSFTAYSLVHSYSHALITCNLVRCVLQYLLFKMPKEEAKKQPSLKHLTSPEYGKIRKEQIKVSSSSIWSL